MRSVVIGTSAICEIRVADEHASPQHCRVVRHDDGTLWVADLGSMNGTFLRSVVTLGGLSVRLHDELRVRGGPEPWKAGQTLWVGRSGLELDHRGWVRAVSR